MAEVWKFDQPPVPDEFAERLRAMHAAGDPALGAVLKLAHDNGWNFRPLADALGVSRQAVEQRISRATGYAVGVEIPPPPRRPTPMPKPSRRLTLRPEVVDQLREMHAIAKTVNGGMEPDNPARRVSERFTAQLAAYIEQGMTVYYLAQVLGVTHHAVYSRLARHGYRKHVPSMAGKPGETYQNKKHTGGPGGKRRDQCQRGHPMTGDNLDIARDGRRCRTCRQARAREYYQRMKSST